MELMTKGFTTWGPVAGQCHHLYRTRYLAENGLAKDARNAPTDRQIVVVASNDMMFFDEKFQKPIRTGKNKFILEFQEGVKTADTGKYQTVKEALNEFRKMKGKVTGVFIRGQELFYKGTFLKEDSVYPVSRKTAEQEAEFFGLRLEEV